MNKQEFINLIYEAIEPSSQLAADAVTLIKKYVPENPDLIEGEKFPRQCAVTGEGLWSGYVLGNDDTIKDDDEILFAHLIKTEGMEEINRWLTFHANLNPLPLDMTARGLTESQTYAEAIRNASYDLGCHYYTEWPDDDIQCIVKDGQLVDYIPEDETKYCECGEPV
jgi:hypothetical protein